MHAVEFEADVQNGMITLPESLQGAGTHIRLIALLDDPQNADQGVVSTALAYTKALQGYPLDWEHNKLTREQMNER